MGRGFFKAAGWMLLIIFLSGCGNKCEKECGECGTLDEGTCECIYTDIECLCSNGEIDGDEDYIDCGGSCDPCVCDFDPCVFLTDGDDKVWKYVETIDNYGNVITPTECDRNWTYTFFVQHIVEFGCPQNPRYSTMKWEFNDQENPTGMIFTDAFGKQYGYVINTLSADTLQIMEQFGLSTYVPE